MMPDDSTKPSVMQLIALGDKAFIYIKLLLNYKNVNSSQLNINSISCDLNSNKMCHIKGIKSWLLDW